MADLNELKTKVLSESREIADRLKALYGDYEQMYQESFKELASSRNASGGSMEGLETFYLAVQTVRRNRDVVVSLMKGLKSLRPLDNFQFIEEDFEEEEKKAEAPPNISDLRIEEPRETEGNTNA
jgi:hypothetical protein